jgi:NTP pyrophosphatase (non-canonical NTP hydrolase)
MAKDDETTIEELKATVKEFCDKRDWDQFHDAKELSIALSIEASELLEHFRWKTKEEVRTKMSKPEKVEEIKDEMADILYFLLRIAQMENIDLSVALKNKIEKNEIKYPVEKAKGSSKKYNEYEQ